MLIDYFYVQLLSVQVALPLECTKEVIVFAQREICPIPGVASALLGVVNQRGRMLWVLQLSELLRLPPSSNRLRSWSSTQDSLTTLVITSSPNQPTTSTTQLTLACVVTTLKGVVSLNPETFKPVPAKLSPALKAFLTGVVKIENSLVAVLNVNAIFKHLQ